MTRKSVQLVTEYMLGTLNLTVFSQLLTCERYAFSPRGHLADDIGQVHSDWAADQLKLDLMEEDHG